VLRRPGTIVALTLLAIGCILGSVGLLIRPGTDHATAIGELVLYVDAYSFGFFWGHRGFLLSQILIGSILVLPTGIYIVWQLILSRRRTAPGFPMDDA
jgi:hypothetical protein